MTLLLIGMDNALAETKIADPASHAKKQVSELDKTAKRSIAKRKFITEQLENDEKEIHHIDAQIARINERLVNDLSVYCILGILLCGDSSGICHYAHT